MDRKNNIKISIVMIDGGFRENIHGVKYFLQQEFSPNQFEIIWVEFFKKINPQVSSNPRIKAISLNKKGIYHSSYCFNRGIEEARGELIIIPDADQIVKPDFLNRVWNIHNKYEKLVVYGYRYDEVREGILKSYDFTELEDKCILKNPINYGGCLTIRKKWLIEMNGYEQHDVFRTGIHANGLLMATRFKNMGLAIQWEPTLKLYHPWHPFTLASSIEYHSQHRVIQWFQSNMIWKAIEGLDPSRNMTPNVALQKVLDEELNHLNSAIMKSWNIKSLTELSGNITQPLHDTNKNLNKMNLFAKIKARFLDF